VFSLVRAESLPAQILSLSFRVIRLEVGKSKEERSENVTASIFDIPAT
jgi:hypothetical protein